MVFINGVKYACERCIRGHRVTTCNHTDQALIMIKPKGRPSTTCDHCKALRKNKNANPSGTCTCGRQAKKKAALNDCQCADSGACVCHGKRKRRGTKSSVVTSGSTSHANKVHKPKRSSSISSFPSSLSVEDQWDGASFSSRGPENILPVNEYSGLERHDFFSDVPLPFEASHGLLDFFTNVSKGTSPAEMNSPPLNKKTPREDSLDHSGLSPNFMGQLNSIGDLDYATNLFNNASVSGNVTGSHAGYDQVAMATQMSGSFSESNSVAGVTGVSQMGSNAGFYGSNSGSANQGFASMTSPNSLGNGFDSLRHAESLNSVNPLNLSEFEPMTSSNLHTHNLSYDNFGTMNMADRAESILSLSSVDSSYVTPSNLVSEVSPDSTNKSVEVLSLTPNFMDIPNGDLFGNVDNSGFSSMLAKKQPTTSSLKQSLVKDSPLQHDFLDSEFQTGFA